jgi:hypothetical protein
VVKLGRFELTGFLGWLFWSVVHIYFLIEARDRFIVAFTWLWDYVTFQRGARLITEVPTGGEELISRNPDSCYGIVEVNRPPIQVLGVHGVAPTTARRCL